MQLQMPDDGTRALAALAELTSAPVDIDDLLSELLGSVVEVLAADTAAVLLVEPSGRQLIARAARGIEEEVRQGVRIPVGLGFAGTIAAERRPVRLSRVDPTTVANPILWRKGIRAMLGVPLQHGERLLGVLHVGTLADRTFTDADVDLLTFVGEQVTAAILAHELEDERGAARILQRSLLPTVPPELPGFQFATRYVPAQLGGVGGDWYDAFRLPSGDLWVMTGDVMGHGLTAAVVMGRLRSTLRAYAFTSDDPAEVLALANAKLRFFEPNETATVLCAVSSPPYTTVRVTSAGHLPPVIAEAHREARLLEVPVAVPLGVLGDLRAEVTTCALPLGATFVGYTDGLVERRGESLDVGLERVRAAVRSEDPEVLCRDLMVALVGEEIPRDDVAVIVMRRVDTA